MRRVQVAALVLLAMAVPLIAEPFHVDPSWSPIAEVGTHVNRLGAAGQLEWRAPGPHPAVAIGARLGGEYDFTYLGIPGPSPVGTFNLGGTFDFGPASPAGSPWRGPALRRANELRYIWMCYLDTWGTSQLSGVIAYLHRFDAFSLGLAIQNDLFGLRLRDEYRTAAVEIGGWFPAEPFPLALFIGTKLWTGSTDGNGRLYRGQTYDLTGSIGWQYSAGILYGGVGIGPVTVQAGWDSERIRDAFQNGLHWLIDDGSIPLIPGRADRLYLSLSFDRALDLY